MKDKKVMQFVPVAGFSKGPDSEHKVQINTEGMVIFQSLDCRTGEPAAIVVATDFMDLAKFLTMLESAVTDALTVNGFEATKH